VGTVFSAGGPGSARCSRLDSVSKEDIANPVWPPPTINTSTASGRVGSLLAFGVGVASGVASLLEAFRQEGQQLLRGAEAEFPPRVDFLDAALELFRDRVGPGTQLKHERASHHIVTLRPAPAQDVKFPFNFA
jgi:hypothetical protein